MKRDRRSARDSRRFTVPRSIQSPTFERNPFDGAVGRAASNEWRATSCTYMPNVACDPRGSSSDPAFVSFPNTTSVRASRRLEAFLPIAISRAIGRRPAPTNGTGTRSIPRYGAGARTVGIRIEDPDPVARDTRAAESSQTARLPPEADVSTGAVPRTSIDHGLIGDAGHADAPLSSRWNGVPVIAGGMGSSISARTVGATSTSRCGRSECFKETPSPATRRIPSIRCTPVP